MLPVMPLVVVLVLSCGARKAGSPLEHIFKAAFDSRVEKYVDTSLYPMHVTYKGCACDSVKALGNLRSEIQGILDGPEFRRTEATAKIVLFDPSDKPHVLFELNPNASILPASVEKLFTSSSTIWALGSKYKFTTKLDLAPGAKIQGSRIVGNVYLRPSGDPTLTIEDLDDLASQLRAKGISQIQGDIISDLDGENPLSDEAREYMAGHPEEKANEVAVHDSVVVDNGVVASADTTADENADEDEEQSEAGALSLFPNFSLNRNIVSVTVIGGAAKGRPASVRVFPPLSTVAISNHSTSSAPATYRVKRVGRGRHKRTIRTMARGAMSLRVSSSGGPMDPVQTIAVAGQVPARSQRTYSFALKNVPLAMAAVMKWRLANDGIPVSGKPVVDRAKPGAVTQTVAVVETSLLDLLTQMNKRSDNYLAESMFRKLSTIASVAATAPDERARKLMRSWLEVCNVDGTNCTFIDGSGLSKSNRTTANTVVALLASIRQQGMFELFTHTLSVAGYDGTLRHRMIGTPAQFNAHGKTGTLNGVTALAGYVTTGDGQLAAYFITMQRYRGGPWAYKQDQNKVVEALANFKYADYQALNAPPKASDSEGK